MATIDSLAPELLDEIFGHLSVDYLDLLSWSYLLHASLVCRSWRDPAQRALFWTVVLHGEDQGEAWLKSPARLRYQTKKLGMRSFGRKALPKAILEACPDLWSLSLGDSIDGGCGWLTSDLVQ